MNLLSAILLKAKLYIILAPIAIQITGGVMNQAVLVANGGKFPVMINDREAATRRFRVYKGGFLDDVHCRMTDETRLNFLADYIKLDGIMSPGDILIGLGDTLLPVAFYAWLTLAVMQFNRRPE